MTFVLIVCFAGLLVIAAVRARVSREPRDEAVQRLAVLQGIERVLGESEASLKRRAVALSRWPYTKVAPEVAWWAAPWSRIRGAR